MYGGGRELELHVAWAGERMVGALPLMVPAKGLRIAELAGGGPSLGDLVIARGSEEVARGLVEHARGRGYDGFDLFAVPQESVLARVAGQRLRLIDRVEASVLELPDGWEAAYRAKVKSKHRNQYGRQRRELGKLGRLEVVVARAIEDLEPALEEAFRVHDLRWAGRYDNSDFATPEGRGFHRAALRALAAIDVPRIVSLVLDGRAIAFHYYLAVAGRMYGHRLAFDPAFARFSPGALNLHDSLQSASDEGLKTIELLRGREAYKIGLADRVEPMYEALGMAGSMRGLLVLSARAVHVSLRKRLRRSQTLRRLYFENRRLVRTPPRGYA